MMMDIGRISEAKPQARSAQQDDPNERKQIAAVIRDYIARERMSREQFAYRTRLGKSTVDKLLTGLFSDKTLSIVESHTRLSLTRDDPRARTLLRLRARTSSTTGRLASAWTGHRLRSCVSLSRSSDSPGHCYG